MMIYEELMRVTGEMVNCLSSQTSPSQEVGHYTPSLVPVIKWDTSWENLSLELCDKIRLKLAFSAIEVT